MNLREGTVLDHRYELRARLGQGSLWKAYDRAAVEERALKIVDLEGHDSETVERARREAHLLMDARHPSLVSCSSLFEIPADNLLVLVFDLLKAESLADNRNEPRLTRVHKLAALRQLARALSYVHSFGIVHGDLRPDNVLITPVFWEDPTAPDSLKLIDFGIAGQGHEEDGPVTSRGHRTSAYLAPELFEAPDAVAHRGAIQDVFSFGVLAFELLYGSHPTELPARATAGAYHGMYQHFRVGREPWPPRPLEGRWGAMITACLALDPNDRPADGAAIVRLLGEGPDSRPALREEPSREPVEIPPPEPAKVEAPPIEPVKVPSPPVEPVKQEVPAIEPVKVESAPIEPVKEEVPAIEPVKVESAPIEPVKVESAPIEPVKVESAPIEPVKEEVPIIEPVKVESALTEAPSLAPSEAKPPIESPAVEPSPIESFQANPPTEIAPLGSLPRSPALERTTPMAPQIFGLAPAVNAKPPEPSFPEPSQKKAFERPPSIKPASTTLPAGLAPAVQKRRSEESAEKSAWWTIAVGVLLCAVPIAIALWFAWGGAGDHTRPPPGLILPSEAPPAGISAMPEPGLYTTGAPAPATTSQEAATSTPSETEEAIELCCGKGQKKCSSGRPCKPGTCKERIDPDRMFLLRVLSIQERPSIYDNLRDLAQAPEHRDSKVCLHTASPPGVCPSMKAIAARNIPPEDRLLVSAKDIIDGRIQVRIKPPKGKGMSATLAPTKGLLTTALCGGVRLKDRKEQLILQAHLDDIDAEDGASSAQ